MDNNTENNTTKNKFSVRVIAIILIICILAAAGYFGFNAYKNYEIRKDPVKWVMYGAISDGASNTIYEEANTKLKLQIGNSDEDSEYTEIMQSALQNFSLETKASINRKMQEAYYDFDVLYKNADFVDVKLYVDNTGMVISSPALYEKNMYINWADINKLNGNNNSKIDKDKYISLFENGDAKLGKKYFDEVVTGFDPYFKKNGSVTVNYTDVNGVSQSKAASEVDCNITSTELVNIITGIIKNAANDNDVKTFARSKTKEFIALVDKNNDYKNFNFTKSQGQEALNKFDTNYDKIAKEISNSMDKINEGESDISGNISAKFMLDNDNKLKEADYDLKIKNSNDSDGGIQSMDITTNAKIDTSNSNVSIKTLSRSGATNLAKLSDDEKSDLQDEISTRIREIATTKILKSGF